MGNVILWELCKLLEFQHTNKKNMHKSEYVLGNETNNLLWNFDKKFLARTPDLVLIHKKKRSGYLLDFTVPADHWVKAMVNETLDKYMGFARKLKKWWSMKVTVIPIVVGAQST